MGISREGIQIVRGGWGVGERNDGGERVIDFALTFDLAMINTFFENKIHRLISYSSGGRESQIDLLLCKRDQLKEARNCKVINGGSIAAQHGWTPNKTVTIGVTRRKVEQSVKKMKNSKAAGPDNIPVEVWKSLGEEGIDVMWDLMQKIFIQEKMPEGWRRSLIIPLYKGKGDIQKCGNYRGIKLISSTMKMWENIIKRSLRDETTIEEEQFGFMPGRGTDVVTQGIKDQCPWCMPFADNVVLCSTRREVV
ncbi:uncharacterized protein [Palaemon carinicauda]|uniref:uncharacterized protein n=1 Tax=Palaemon carinicauda TaxID=392227 RepID=UPI0035B5FCBB